MPRKHSVSLTLQPLWPFVRMEQALQRRREKGTLRRLPFEDHGGDTASEDKLLKTYPETTSMTSSKQTTSQTIDFSSNDYLGLAHSEIQHQKVEQLYHKMIQQQQQQTSPLFRLGATGSRLLSGDHPAFHALEKKLARWHNRKVALLCNSGYDANLCVVSSLPCRVVLYDEESHNSLHMGLRLWQQQSNQETRRVARSFQHNRLSDLRRLLEEETDDKATAPQQIMILVESIYSMGGDEANLSEILDLALEFGAFVVVDEAHALGVCGRQGRETTNQDTLQQCPGTGLLAQQDLEHHPALFAAVYTFGKGAGCHGAVLVGNSKVLRDYWINFCYPFIYSTALPLHSLATIQASYSTMTCHHNGGWLRAALQSNIRVFRDLMKTQILDKRRTTNEGNRTIRLLPSSSPIQAMIVPGNEHVTVFCQILYTLSGTHRIKLFPIKSPTVAANQERVRIALHTHNTLSEIQLLVHLIGLTLQQMGLLPQEKDPQHPQPEILSKL